MAIQYDHRLAAGSRGQQKIDIHRYGQRLARIKETLEEMNQGRVAVEFLNKLKLEGLRDARLCFYGSRLTLLVRLFNTMQDAPVILGDATKRQCEAVMADVISRNYRSETKRAYALALMRLVHFAKTGEIGDMEVHKYVDEISWIKPSRYMDKNEVTISPEDLLTPDEITALLSKINGKRDRALFWVLLEGAFRIGELMQIRVGGVDFKGDHVVVTSHGGKTGTKRVTLVLSFRPLLEWLSEHPQRGDPNATLWYSNAGGTKTNVVSYQHINMTLKRCAREAGIKKKVWLYLLRHTQLTLLAKKLSDQTLRVYGNWSPNSDMAKRYVHLSSQDVGEAILAMHGLRPEGGDPPTVKIAKCPKCRESNTPDAQRCFSCGYIMSSSLLASMSIEDEIKEKELREGMDKIANIEVIVEDTLSKYFRKELEKAESRSSESS